MKPQASFKASTWKSWNGLKEYSYSVFHAPTSSAELQTIVAQSDSLRVVGTGRSSADICGGCAELLSLHLMPDFYRYDPVSRTVHVGAGMMLSELIQRMERDGRSFGALPDIDCITVGGAVSTGTHGTGRGAQSLSDYLVSITIILADGTRQVIDKSSPMIHAMQVSIGLLGIIEQVEFATVDLFTLALKEFPIDDRQWLSTWREHYETNDFLRLLWLPHTGFGYAIIGNKFTGEAPFTEKKAPEWHRYRRDVSSFLYSHSHNLPFLTALANQILKRLFFSSRTRKTGTLYGSTVTKSRGSTLELAEWTIPFDAFNDCFKDMKKGLSRLDNHAYAHIPMDIRFMDAGQAWLGNNNGNRTVTVGCVSRTPAHADSYRAFGLVESVFLAHGGRPHWAKRFKACRAQLQKLYPAFDDFVALRRSLDPACKFLNKYLAGIFG